MTIPHSPFAVFQLMFAAITPALITGAFAERKRFKTMVAAWLKAPSTAALAVKEEIVMLVPGVAPP